MGLHGLLCVVGGDHDGGGHGAGVGQFHQMVPDRLPGTVTECNFLVSRQYTLNKSGTNEDIHMTKVSSYILIH